MKQVVIIFALLSFIDCTVMVKREEDNVIGVKSITGGSLALKWNLFNFVGIDDYIIQLYYNKEEKKNLFAQESVSATASEVINARPILEIDVPFKDRLKGSINVKDGNGTCNLQILNVTYGDEGAIILIAFVTGTDISTAIRENITFSVKGGPYTCQESIIPQNFSCTAGNQMKGNITLCGKPQPQIIWFIGDKAFNGSVVESMISQHQYTYTFNEKVTTDMCGKDISYVANGYTGTKKEIVSKVLLKKFNVSNAIFNQTRGECPILTWEAEDHGLCQVDMFVSFLQNDNSTMNITIPVKNQTFQDCRITMNSTAIYYKTIVYLISENGTRVQISEDDNSMNKTIVHNVELQTTTTTTTTTTTKTTTTTTTTTTTPSTTTNTTDSATVSAKPSTPAPPAKTKNSNEGDKLDLGLVIGATVGVIFFITLLVVLFICIKKMKKEDKATDVPMKDLPTNERAPSQDIEGLYAKVDKSKKNQTNERPVPTPNNDYDELSAYQDAAQGSSKSPEELAVLYAPVNKRISKPSKSQPDPHSIYSELGPGGGRVGPRPTVEPSNYAEAKDLFNEYSNLEDEENKKDEASAYGYVGGKENGGMQAKDDNDSDGLSGGAIAGIIVGVIVLIIICVVAVLYLRGNQRKTAASVNEENEETKITNLKT